MRKKSVPSPAKPNQISFVSVFAFNVSDHQKSLFPGTAQEGCCCCFFHPLHGPFWTSPGLSFMTVPERTDVALTSNPSIVPMCSPAQTVLDKPHNLGSMSVLLQQINLLNVLLWMCPFTVMQWKTGFVKEPSVSNAMFDNHHVNISQLGAGEFSVIDQCDSVGSFPFHSYSSETGVRVYSRSITSTGHRPDRFGVIPSQQRYRLRRWQRLIRNILMTMSDSVILLSQHPDWFTGLVLLLFFLDLKD